MLGWGRGGEPVGRSAAAQVVNDRRFPAPVISHPPEEPDRPRERLWLLLDVDRWMDRNRPGWRARRPAVDPAVPEDAPTTRAHIRAAVVD